MDNSVLYAPILTQMVFFQDIQVFPPISWIGLGGANLANLHIQTRKLQEVLLSKR